MYIMLKKNQENNQEIYIRLCYTIEEANEYIIHHLKVTGDLLYFEEIIPNSENTVLSSRSMEIMYYIMNEILPELLDYFHHSELYLNEEIVYDCIMYRIVIVSNTLKKQITLEKYRELQTKYQNKFLHDTSKMNEIGLSNIESLEEYKEIFPNDKLKSLSSYIN